MSRYTTWTCSKCSIAFKSPGGHRAWCGQRREAAFWNRVDKSAGPDACWLWGGARFKKKNKQMGYGRFSASGPYTYAHRCAWIFTHGQIPADKIIMHSCDVVLCCNPAHMRLGTDKENMADMWAKGRGSNGRNRDAAGRFDINPIPK